MPMMDGGAASIVNSTLRISQIVYEFKAVGEQARDLLASTNHVNKAIETTRELRRQKSAYLASTEKEWIDSTIVAAERTLNNVASLVEPVRVDMQTKFGKIGLLNRGLFVFRDSPKVLTHLNQLSMTHVSLVNALSTLSQRQADTPLTPSPVLDRRASHVTLSGPPTYEESEFLGRRRGKMRSTPSLANMAEENPDATSSVDEGSSESNISNTASLAAAPVSSRAASPRVTAAIDMTDEKCLVSEIGDALAYSYSMPELHDQAQYTSPAELDGNVSATWGRQRPFTYQAWDPSMNGFQGSSQWQPPEVLQHSSSHRPHTRHSEPNLPTIPLMHQQNKAQDIPKIVCSNQSDELHFLSASTLPQDRRLSSSASTVPSPLRPANPTSPAALHSRSELPSRAQTPIRPTPLPYPDDLIPTNSSNQFRLPTPQPPVETTIGLGVTLPSGSHQSNTSTCHRTQSYPSSATQTQRHQHQQNQSHFSSSFSERPGPHPQSLTNPSLSARQSGPASEARQPMAATQPPLERSVSQPTTGSSGRSRRYAWLEHQSAQAVVEDFGLVGRRGVP